MYAGIRWHRHSRWYMCVSATIWTQVSPSGTHRSAPCIPTGKDGAPAGLPDASLVILYTEARFLYTVARPRLKEIACVKVRVPSCQNRVDHLFLDTLLQKLIIIISKQTVLVLLQLLRCRCAARAQVYCFSIHCWLGSFSRAPERVSCCQQHPPILI